jgi:diaminopimelate epimerase
MEGPMNVSGIKFSKMNGSGNDFILIDNMDKKFCCDEFKKFISLLCRRKLSIGADGVIILEPSAIADFKWRFFNADGSEAEMCGNGSRCAAKYAYLNNIAKKSLKFETIAGVIEAEVKKDSVKVLMTKPFNLKIDYEIFINSKKYYISSINTGVPHVVKFVKELENYDVYKMGKLIRFHELFQPNGTNVNFVSIENKDTLNIRTYERGVEDETLACGTGSVAAALIAYKKGFVKKPVKVKNRGGEILLIDFILKDNDYKKVYLEGDARLVFNGEILEDAIQ